MAVARLCSKHFRLTAIPAPCSKRFQVLQPCNLVAWQHRCIGPSIAKLGADGVRSRRFHWQSPYFHGVSTRISTHASYTQNHRHEDTRTQVDAGSKNRRENIYTLPNLLTLSRLIAAPAVGYLVLHDYHAWAFGLFVYAGVTDLVDGYIARRWNLQTVVGTVIDPMADKALMTILTVCLTAQGLLPVWLAVIILGRDIALGFAAIYYRWISLPPPKTFRRYWDFSLPSAEVHPTTISKYNTALQLGVLGMATAMPMISLDLGTVMVGMQYLVASTTVLSGLSYVFSSNAVKILKDPSATQHHRGS